MQGDGSVMAMIFLLLRKPNLWLEAVRTGGSISKRHSVPRLLPDQEFLEWRLSTVYGDSPFVREDLVAFLEWRKRQRRLN